ncbi:ABC transporter ATP-binding protein [Candidatus Nitronereus thalassa]|uniref:ABC transporter ATP-binding protein n=1 Tax=Candidatus Nitronereus thalassa TaxID=3020898 RepID=A0ABU3K5A6_9BACT|nr:ABC transporter ATP-binding protein [Candidatus Nitronereus thalassa]MDT7041575.1 ABC transporter ATP-binding protein [Candidatus Nitronereus thalassa]
MNNIAIQVKDLGKKYHIGAKKKGYQTFREALTEAVVAPFRRARDLVSGKSTGAAELNEEFWALENINISIQKGEVVGIIGPNGAGKSTLLKVLSRIVEPTEGYADINGRIGSLLEVGTGFHPELTGRENVFLNGAILGMRKSEIYQKFDEIVAFAEVGKFIDTPVKHYSSGMYLRLAFSVAAHLEPEILLVDEVLAVGDANFQKKCLGKMNEVSKKGRTVLFVSHNMSAIRTLCNRAILLEHGRVKYDGEVFGAIKEYHGALKQTETTPQMGKIVFSNIVLKDNSSLSIKTSEPLEIGVTLNIWTKIDSAKLWCIIKDAEGNFVLHHRIDHTELMEEMVPGKYQVKIYIPALWLRPGPYNLHFKAITNEVGSRGRYVSDPRVLDIEPCDEMYEDLAAALVGQLCPPVSWELKHTSHTPLQNLKTEHQQIGS